MTNQEIYQQAITGKLAQRKAKVANWTTRRRIAKHLADKQKQERQQEHEQPQPNPQRQGQ